jgi:glycosyltransferase involved in cell wall biosynthesis
VKILIGMPAKDSWGGPAASEPPFVEQLRKLGIEVREETYVYGDKESSTPIFSRAIRVIRTALRFRKLLREDTYDLIQLNTAFDKKTVLRDAVSLVLMGARSKVFLKIHGAGAHLIGANSFFYRRLIAVLDNRVSGYGVFTRDELESFRPHGLDQSKFHIVKNIIDFGYFLPKEERLQKESNEEFKLLFVSRFIPTKGLLETIRACAILRERGVKFTLDCVGDGPIRSDAEALCNRLELSDLVTFTGYISEERVAEYLLKSDIFIFPTRHTEGFPIALFKAAATGMPIVTTRVRAAAEYFEEPKNCLFCTEDPQNIAMRMEELVGDKLLREQMSAANREFREMLTPQAITEEYLSIYKQIW